MQTKSTRKVTVLGLVLMAASAVTAAVLPSKHSLKSSGEGDNNGTLRNYSGSAAGRANVISCIPREFDDFNSFSCTASNDAIGATNTTSPGRNDSTIGLIHLQTQGNTSQTKLVAGNQESILAT